MLKYFKYMYIKNTNDTQIRLRHKGLWVGDTAPWSGGGPMKWNTASDGVGC